MTAFRYDPAQAAPYVAAGLDLIPLHRWDRVDQDARGRRKRRGKSPQHVDWTTRRYDPARVLADAARDGTNVGVRLPPTVVVLDVDPRNFGDGDSLLSLMIDTGLDLRDVPHAVTGSGGAHYWFSKPQDVTLLDSLDAYPGVEFKSAGRQVVAAGSRHPDGGAYAWPDGPGAVDLRSPPPLPPKLLAMARRPVASHQDVGGLGELTPRMLEETLSQLDPCDFSAHEDWLQLMMACHHATAGEGRQEFVDWSTGDPAYADDGWIIGRRWDSLHASGSSRAGRPITVRYLHKVVQARGGEVARAAPEDDFGPWEEDVPDGHGVDDDRLRAEEEPPQRPGAEGVIDAMNEVHAVVMEGGKFRIFTREVDPVLERPFYQRSTKEDFENLYCNRLVEVGDKLVTQSSLWIRSARRRQYKGVIFDPERDHPGWLNLWEGWAVQPSPGDWSLLQQLTLEVLVDGNRDHYEWVLNWMAYMVQHPARAAEVAICFRGKKGTGKGTLGRALGGLAGAHSLHISSPEHLVGRFNSHLQNCLYLFADEAFWAGDKAGEAKLKQLVTEPTIAYEGKGRDAVTGKNFVHIMMAANGDWMVPAGLDGERRFAVFEVNESRRGDKAFFGALNRQLYREGGLAAMLHDLATRDIGDWAPRDGVPATRALMDQKVLTMDDVERWWYGKLIDGMLPAADGDWEAGSVVAVKSSLRADYAEYARDQRVYRPADEVAFGMRLGKLVALKNTLAKPRDTDYGARVSKDGRASAYRIPPLAECRAAMEERFGARMF